MSKKEQNELRKIILKETNLNKYFNKIRIKFKSSMIIKKKVRTDTTNLKITCEETNFYITKFEKTEFYEKIQNEVLNQIKKQLNKRNHKIIEKPLFAFRYNKSLDSENMLP
ncbi:hypothetical protein ACFL0W_01360 [Nanoarchaeota archaeon]